MSGRELIALGTGSQVPTRERNHNGYFLRWEKEGFIFDPGEGTQRQLIFAGLSACSVHHVCITHFHGDHCLGLPGLLQRQSLDGCNHAVTVYYPESGKAYFERLREASIYYSELEVIARPVAGLSEGLIELRRTDAYVLSAHALDHSVPTVGYRLEELPRRHFIDSRLQALGISGPRVGELARGGTITVGQRVISADEVSEQRPGMVLAFIMDTRPCAGALELARNADLLVMEATYTTAERELAMRYGHCTAADAALTALQAGARRLALTHFSPRYLDTETHLREARGLFPETIALCDLDRVDFPRCVT